MSNQSLDTIKFPSGRKAGQIKKDAKKLSKANGISHIEALDHLASENGSKLNWQDSIEVLSGNCPLIKSGLFATINYHVFLSWTSEQYREQLKTIPLDVSGKTGGLSSIDNPIKHISYNLEELMKEQGLTVDDIVAKTELTPSVVQDILYGEYDTVDDFTLKSLCECFDVHVDDLIDPRISIVF